MRATKKNQNRTSEKTGTPGTGAFTRKNYASSVAAFGLDTLASPVASAGPQSDFARIPLSAPRPKMRSRAAVKPAGDVFEREADEVAERVTGTEPKPGSAVPQSIRPKHSESEGGEQAKTIRRSQAASPKAESAPHPDAAVRAAKQGGTPLSSDLRSYFEPRFREDFSGVRVHTNSQAADGARAVQARAYTMGRDIVFGPGEFAPASTSGKRLLAHELTHVVQQKAGASTNTLQRVPAPPSGTGGAVPFDRSKIDVGTIPDIVAASSPSGLVIAPQSATATFSDHIAHLDWELYDHADKSLDAGGAANTKNHSANYVIQNNDPQRSTWPVVQGRYILRSVGYDSTGKPVAYADRSFYVWTSKPTGKPPDIAALEAQKTQLESTTQTGSKKSFGEVGSAFAKLKDVTHDLSVLQTGTGTYVGNRCPVVPAGTTPTDCTNIVLEVLGDTFTQQGKGAEWAKVKKKYAENTKARGGGGLSGLDVQAALQSESGWKGVFWAPDPAYQVPKAELDKANSDEASDAYRKAKKGTYYKDFGKAGYPGVSISQTVVNYAPEAPKEPRKAGYPAASTTTKDTSQLDKLKKVPFGVLAAHGGEHMTIITYGKVIEVHWRKEATSQDVIEQTDLE